MRWIFLILLPASLLANPWGRDADLVSYKEQKRPTSPQKKVPSPLSQAAEGIIWFHQNFISKADGPRSHFVPSSSQYTLEAIRKYGFFKGYILGCDRLMRENQEEWIYQKTKGPYCMLKHDPVP